MTPEELNALADRVERLEGARGIVVGMLRKYQSRTVDVSLSRNERTRCSHYVQVLNEVAAALASENSNAE
jgi:hypothetical protein